MLFRVFQFIIVFPLLISGCSTAVSDPPKKLQVLIIDGVNNHYVWPKTTLMMKDYLEATRLFEVKIHRMDTIFLGIKYNAGRVEHLEYYIEEFPIDSNDRVQSPVPDKHTDFDLDFSGYDLIVSNLGGDAPEWPAGTQRKFERFVQEGGGFVSVHATNNLWANWEAFNEMIGLGAWGGRDSTSGPFVYYNEAGELEKDHSARVCGSHGLEQEHLIELRAFDHPVTKGLPKQWLHAKDELYDRMRGPFKQAAILATAYSDIAQNAQPWEPVLPGSGKHVPVLLAVNYGKGRVFHTTLGHFDYSMECLGFITTFQRGAEWAATGAVTQAIPDNFPNADTSRSRKWVHEKAD